jgi:hypothetical protein
VCSPQKAVLSPLLLVIYANSTLVLLTLSFRTAADSDDADDTLAKADSEQAFSFGPPASQQLCVNNVFTSLAIFDTRTPYQWSSFQPEYY